MVVAGSHIHSGIPTLMTLAPGAVQCVALDVDGCRLYFDNGYDDGVDG